MGLGDSAPPPPGRGRMERVARRSRLRLRRGRCAWMVVFIRPFLRPLGARGWCGVLVPRVALRFTRGYRPRPLRGRFHTETRPLLCLPRPAGKVVRLWRNGWGLGSHAMSEKDPLRLEDSAPPPEDRGRRGRWPSLHESGCHDSRLAAQSCSLNDRKTRLRRRRRVVAPGSCAFPPRGRRV